MRFEMKMPDLAATESEIRIVRWLVQPGERIQRGQMYLEVETDKATMEVEASVTGVLHEITRGPGDSVEVGEVVAVLEVDGGKDVTAPAQTTAAIMASPAVQPPATSPTTTGSPPPDKRLGMFARNRAAAAAAKSQSRTDLMLTLPQRTAARRLQESKQTIPHFYLQSSFNASRIAQQRSADSSVKLAWDAFFVRAVARALTRFDRFCYRLEGEQLSRCNSDAIGVAVDESDNLYVIPIGSPLAKSVQQISEEIRRGLQQLKDGDPDARRIRPAVMTITNLGMCNVECFVPIINPPEVAILGVGRVRPEVVAYDDGRLGIEQRCTLTLSVDHRVASGRYAGQFLGEIIRELEST